MPMLVDKIMASWVLITTALSAVILGAYAYCSLVSEQNRPNPV